MLNKLRNWFKKPKSSDTITVTVTTEDYKSATSFVDSENCPLAMCLKRHGYKNPYVKSYCVIIKKTSYEISDNWAKESSNKIDNDIYYAKNGGTIEPTTVTLTKQ